jgi:hypothetical protein
MAKIESRSDVRRKVREAQTRAQQERLKRESDNREDMVAFLLAEQKLQAVDDWEAEHVAQVHGDAEQRRHEQRVEGAKALARMKARGETIKDIAVLGGVPEKLVRSYLKLAASTVAVQEAGGNGSQPLGSGDAPADPQALGSDAAAAAGGLAVAGDGDAADVRGADTDTELVEAGTGGGK